jgi:hypothetical protein
VDQCISEEEKKQKWRYTVNHYNFAMVVLQQKQTICNIQLMLECAYIVLHSIYKRDIATNYFHLLSSIHGSWSMLDH